MDSTELYNHPKLKSLIKHFEEKFPKVDFKKHFMSLGYSGYSLLGLGVDEVKVVLEKCLKENKYFKVWELNYKGNGSIPDDWWEGKVVYYRYKS